MIDADENPVGLLGFAAFLLLPFTALGVVVLAWVHFVERRSLATIGLVQGHRIRTLLFGQLVGVSMATAIVAGIWIAGNFDAGAYAPAFHSPAALGGIAILWVCSIVQSGVEELREASSPLFHKPGIARTRVAEVFSGVGGRTPTLKSPRPAGRLRLRFDEFPAKACR